MWRLGCEEEAVELPDSPFGCVQDNEPIVLAFIPPRTTPQIDGSIGSIPSDDWKRKQLSVFRASKGTFANFDEKVIERRRTAFVGYGWALAGALRDIMASRRDGAPPTVGAACVIEDSIPDIPAHARMGECKPCTNFWNTHDRTTARLNVILEFQRNGIHKVEVDGLFAEAIDTGHQSPATEI